MRLNHAIKVPGIQLGLGTDNLDPFHASARADGITFTGLPADMHGARILMASRFRSAAAKVPLSLRLA